MCERDFEFPPQPVSRNGGEMKTQYIIAMGALASTLAIVPPCTAESNLPPQNAAQPQIYPPPTGVIWDGSKYVGQMNGKYYYLGPNNTWLPMDNTRQQRFDQWQKNRAAGNPGEQSSQIGNTRSGGPVRGQNANEGQPAAQNPGGNNPSGQSSQIRNTRHQGHDLGQTRTAPPTLQQ